MAKITYVSKENLVLYNTLILAKIAEISGNIGLTDYVTKAMLHTVATSGSYKDLIDKPTNLVTTAELTAAIEKLIGTAPEALDTLGEIAEELAKNKDLHDTIVEAIAKKADKTELDNYVKNTLLDAAVTEILKKTNWDPILTSFVNSVLDTYDWDKIMVQMTNAEIQALFA